MKTEIRLGKEGMVAYKDNVIISGRMKNRKLLQAE